MDVCGQPYCLGDASGALGCGCRDDSIMYVYNGEIVTRDCLVAATKASVGTDNPPTTTTFQVSIEEMMRQHAMPDAHERLIHTVDGGRAVMVEPHRCANCHSPLNARCGNKPRRCGACMQVYYCDPLCQKADWKHHKPLCANYAADKAEAKKLSRPRIKALKRAAKRVAKREEKKTATLVVAVPPTIPIVEPVVWCPYGSPGPYGIRHECEHCDGTVVNVCDMCMPCDHYDCVLLFGEGIAADMNAFGTWHHCKCVCPNPPLDDSDSE